MILKDGESFSNVLKNANLFHDVVFVAFYSKLMVYLKIGVYLTVIR